MKYAKVFLIAGLTSCAQATLQTQFASVQGPAEPRLSYSQLLVAARDALNQGHADAASTLAADACRLDSQRPEAYLVRGQALAQNDHVADSSKAFEHARALGCRDAELFMALASNYDVEHRYKEATAVYLDYLSDHPHDIAMRDELGLTYLLLGDTQSAIAQLELARRQAPTHVQVRQDLGYALLQAQAFDKAEATLAELCQAAQASPEAQRLWAQALAGQRRYGEALRIIDALLEHQPLDSGAQRLRAHLQARIDTRAQAADGQGPDNISPSP